jgi:hypothetical protein
MEHPGNAQTVIEVAQTYFPAITETSFPYLFKLQVQTVANFLQTNSIVCIFATFLQFMLFSKK